MSKKFKWMWADVSEIEYKEWNIIRNYIQYEIFEDEIYTIEDFYLDQAGIVLENMGKDEYRYINDNGDVRYVIVFDVEEYRG